MRAFAGGNVAILTEVVGIGVRPGVGAFGGSGPTLCGGRTSRAFSVSVFSWACFRVIYANRSARGVEICSEDEGDSRWRNFVSAFANLALSSRGSIASR
jgi:hypothetical protein